MFVEHGFLLGEIVPEGFRDVYEDRCNCLHPWNIGDCFSSLTQLEEHQKVVYGIALLFRPDKLYTGRHDETKVAKLKLREL